MKKENKKYKRFWEIDALRGLALIFMLIFHFFFDLDFFRITNFDFTKFYWIGFARLIALIFLFLVGVSLTLSYPRHKNFKYFLKRGLKILSWGFCITLITLFLFDKGYIWFGILHFIGLAIIISYPSLKLKNNYLILSIASISIGIGLILNKFSFKFPYLLWLGLKPENFYTFDYFPLFPWLGFIFIGIAFGNKFYKNGKRDFKLIKPRLKILNLILNSLGWLGQHSLFIYLIHQPILSGIILALKLF